MLDAERAVDPAGARGFAIVRETARWLALWMAFDDIVRVAALKGRASRAQRVRREVRAGEADIVKVYDHFKPGAAEFLGALRARGTRCAVASSSTSGQIQACLGSLGVLHHFEAFAGGDEVPRAKPDPALYLLAASRLGVDPTQCIAFEDSENGAKAALAAGLRVVIVPDLKHPPAAIVEQAFHCLLYTSPSPRD